MDRLFVSYQSFIFLIFFIFNCNFQSQFIFSKQSEQDSSLSAATKTFQQVGSLKLKRLHHEIYSVYSLFSFKHFVKFHIFYISCCTVLKLFSQRFLEFIFLLRH
jgi:hypothetical protein